MSFLPPLEMRPSSIAPNPVASTLEAGKVPGPCRGGANAGFGFWRGWGRASQLCSRRWTTWRRGSDSWTRDPGVRGGGPPASTGTKLAPIPASQPRPAHAPRRAPERRSPADSRAAPELQIGRAHV